VETKKLTRSFLLFQAFYNYTESLNLIRSQAILSEHLLLVVFRDISPDFTLNAIKMGIVKRNSLATIDAGLSVITIKA
jgi:hypothetical protein